MQNLIDSGNSGQAMTPIFAVFADAFLVRSRATGPRSSSGKERSKRNALKHGIMSNALLPGESPSEYESVLKQLREDYQPLGVMENMLVEKLAIWRWKYRRFLIAEAAEIRRNRDFLKWEFQSRQIESANQIMDRLNIEESPELLDIKELSRMGLIRHIANPKLLDKCIELLKELRAYQAEHEFSDDDLAFEILNKIYGANDEYAEPCLRKTYYKWHNIVSWSERDPTNQGYPSVQECAANVKAALDAEIERLVQYREVQQRIDSKKLELEKLRSFVLGSPNSDRFLRYETHLERSLERTLSQLERLQSTRLGRPVMPTVKLDISSI